MNVVDSSGWLEYFADGPNAAFFAPPIKDLEHLIVPTISILEVFKRDASFNNAMKPMRYKPPRSCSKESSWS